DFQDNGIPSLAVANLVDSTVSVLLGHGDGSFQAAASYAVGKFPSALAVADLDGDGILDLVVANVGIYPYADSSVSVLLGHGDGTFQPARTFFAGSAPTSVVVADFNGDGIPDLAVANYTEQGTVSILLGNGDGTFQVPQSFPAGNACRSVAVGDFNHDGISDLVVTNVDQGTVSVLLGNGDATF